MARFGGVTPFTPGKPFDACQLRDTLIGFAQGERVMPINLPPPSTYSEGVTLSTRVKSSMHAGSGVQ